MLVAGLEFEPTPWWTQEASLEARRPLDRRVDGPFAGSQVSGVQFIVSTQAWPPWGGQKSAEAVEML